MDEHDVVPLPQEIFGTCAESGWGTCGELLLVSAVKRHGVNKWNLICKELKDRAISLNVNPLYFSEVACKQKFDILKGRYASCRTSSRSRVEDLVNDMHWFEELRKLRVSLLKRELEHYDASIGLRRGLIKESELQLACRNLQVKIKRLKAEQAPDTSVGTQVRNSFANSQSNEEVCEGSSWKFSVQTRVDKPLEGDCNELHNTVTLGSIRNSQDMTASEAPSNSQEQVLPDGEQLHDATDDQPHASPTCTDVKASVNIINNSAFPKSVNGGLNFEQDYAGNCAVVSLAETQFYESPSLQGRLADDLQDTETDQVGNSNVDTETDQVGNSNVDTETDQVGNSNVDEHRELVLGRSGCQLVGGDLADALVKQEAGEVVAHALDNDEVKLGILDLQIGGKLELKMDVVDQGLGLAHADLGQKEMAGTLATSADSTINIEVSKKEGLDHAETEDVTKPILPSSQPLVLSENVGNGEYRHAELKTMTEERVILLKNEVGIGEFGKAKTVEADFHPIPEVGIKQVFEAFPLHVAKVAPGVQLGMTVPEYPDDVTHSISSADEVLNAARNSSRVSEGVTSTVQDEVIIPCEQKQLLLEELDLKEEHLTVRALKELATLDVEDGGSNGIAWKSAITPKESERISAVIPLASFTNSESSVLRDGAVLLSEKSNPRVLTRSSDLLNVSDLSEGSPSPMRHIVIALDDPGITTTPSSENTVTTPANAEVNSSQLNTTTRSDVNCGTEATGIIEEQSISAQSSKNLDILEHKDWDSPHETPSAVDLRLEDCETGPINASVLQGVQADHGFDVASITPVSPKSICKLKSLVLTSTPLVRLDHDAKMTEENSSARIGGTLQVAENSGTVSDHDLLLRSSEAIQVEPGERLDISEKRDLDQSSPSFVANFEGCQSSDSWRKKFPSTVVPHCLVVSKTVPEVSVQIAQMASDLPNACEYGSESTAPEIIVDMKLECGKAELSGVDSEAELKSPLKSYAAGGLDSRMPSSHEGSDNMQDQYKDGSTSDRNREQTQDVNRDHMEIAFDKSEARSPLDVPHEMSPSSRINHKEPRVPGKRFSLVEVFRNIFNHKSAMFFKGRQEDPRYSLLIRRHLDLNFVRARLDEGAYSSSSEFFRDLLLIFNNGMVYYTRGSVEFRGAKALFTETTKEMNRIFQTEALVKQQGRPATRTREVKNPITAFAAPSIGVASSAAKWTDSTISPLPTLLDSGSKKRASSRFQGIAETPTNSHSEGGAAPRSAGVNVFRDPSSSRAEEAENSQENDQEVNNGSRLKDRKRSQSKGDGGASSRGKPHREELLEGILLKNAANKSLGRSLKGKEAVAVARLPRVLTTKGTSVETLADPESEKESEPVEEKMRGIGGEIDNDGDDFLWRGKSLSKLIKDQSGPEVKPLNPKAGPVEAGRVAFKSHGTAASQAVGRPSRSGRKLVTPANEPVRPSVSQAKKRARR